MAIRYKFSWLLVRGVNRAENGETEEPAVTIVLFSEDDPSFLCALPFITKEEISS